MAAGNSNRIGLAISLAITTLLCGESRVSDAASFQEPETGASQARPLDAIEPPAEIKVPPFSITFRLVHLPNNKTLYFATTEVSQADFQMACGFNPSSVTGDTLPVTGVNWFAANFFCSVVGARVHATVRLPTKPEWEFAFGDPSQVKDAEFRVAEDEDEDRAPHAVGSLAANAFGLFDMVGNVAEWCYDGDDASVTVFLETPMAICGDSFITAPKSAHNIVGKVRRGSAIIGSSFTGFRPVLVPQSTEHTK